MDAVDKATETQLINIQARMGKTLEEIYALLDASGKTKHGELRDVLKEDLGLGHGDANTVVIVYRRAREGGSGSAADPADEIYVDTKAHLRPIHEKLLETIGAFGPFDDAPKKGYVSLRRKKQFAMFGPTTRTRVDVGLDMRDIAPTERLKARPPGEMCQYNVAVQDASEVDSELASWLRAAYESAG